ncbi:MAG: GatB/YqeY domain-containing protein [Petrotogales bacterium]
MIFEKINSDIISAMKNKDDAKRNALKYLKSNIQRVAKDSQKDVNDDMCIAVAKKLIKQNQESLNFVDKSTHLYEFDKITFENSIWSEFLPKMLNEEETQNAVSKAISSLGASTMKDMGKVMGALKKEYGQTLDMGLTSKIVKSSLS